MKRKGLMKKLKGIMSLVTLLIMTVSSLGIPAQVFAADEGNVPANLTVKHNDTQKWTVIQFDKVEDADSYKIYRAEEQDGNFEHIQTLKSDTTYAVDPYMELKTDGTLKADYLYYYKVSAVVEGKEQEAAGPVANQDVATKASDDQIEEAAAAPSAVTEEKAEEVTEETTEEQTAAVQTYSSSRHDKDCDTKHSSRKNVTRTTGNTATTATRNIVVKNVMRKTGSMATIVIRSIADTAVTKTNGSMGKIATKTTAVTTVTKTTGSMEKTAMKSIAATTATITGSMTKIAIKA